MSFATKPSTVTQKSKPLTSGVCSIASPTAVPIMPVGASWTVTVDC
jgi:hypothetical protein